MSYISYRAALQNGPMPRLYRTERRTAASLVSYILIGRTMIYPYVSNWTSRAKRCGAGRCDMWMGYQRIRISRASTVPERSRHRSASRPGSWCCLL